MHFGALRQHEKRCRGLPIQAECRCKSAGVVAQDGNVQKRCSGDLRYKGDREPANRKFERLRHFRRPAAECDGESI